MADEGPDFYDNATVFERYMGQRHSTGSANDTIEGPVVRELIGDIRGSACLDLGCGDARFGSELLGGGAAQYVGVEGSSLMFEAASRNVSDPRVCLVHADMRSWDYPVNEFDLVTSRLALHYIDEVDRIFSKVFQALKPSGRFVFSVEHPVITSCDKVWHGEGLRQDWVVDDYFTTGKRITSWLGAKVVKYHRTVEDYFGGLRSAGFVVQSLREARPERQHFQDDATYERRKKIPLFLIIAAQKPGSE